MLKKKLLSVLIAASALSGAESAWSAADNAGADAGQGKGLEEVIVTSRRTDENVQDTPVAVQVLTGEDIQNLNITTPSEISKIAPGLNISFNDPKTPLIVLRGVRWASASGTPAIPMYVNEVPFGPENVLHTMFDVGQVEVVRGPQGTARGAPSISGAVTITTKAPDLSEAGGYISGLLGTDNHRNIQGAYGVPIISDMLAVRVAANAEDSELNHVDSVNGSATPTLKLRSARVSVLFEPTDEFSLNTMYQRVQSNSRFYNQVVGTGSAGRPANAPANVAPFPAGYNGPALSADDYKSVQELPNVNDQTVDFFTSNVAWETLGHTIGYNFGFQDARSRLIGSNDIGNSLVGYTGPLVSDTRDATTTYVVHELRLSSLRDQDHFIDYDAGIFYNKANSDPFLVDTVSLLPGAMGNPFGASSLSPILNPAGRDRYTLPVHLDIGLKREDYSIYGDMAFHLTDDDELTVGARRIREEQTNYSKTTTQPGFATALRNPLFPNVGCSSLSAALVNSPVYPGICDANVPAGSPPEENLQSREYATIFNVSYSHNFSPDVMAYTTVGSSWRGGLPALNNPGLPSGLAFPDPEEATSYEIGVKSTLGRSVRLNADVFYIDYKNQLTQFQNIRYFNSVSNATSRTGVAFFSNIDSEVMGAELELDVSPLDGLLLGAHLSYAEIESAGGEVPCDGPVSAANPINTCTAESGQNLNAAPKFQANVNGSYTMPLGEFDGYVRTIVNFQDKNPNFGASVDSTGAYAIVDLFVGITGDQGAWDLGLYSKNLFDRTIQLTTSDVSSGTNAETLFGPSGYQLVTTTAPREVGVSLRYAFGSR